ncbi:acyl-CoA dehydrogenase family protein [Paraburkholderia caffeinilytica]|uniref:acyl-CoA dehydrogenase family protein n=1 Tax=Paraburkholderia caffeinilytica TaxID=1761016 RepID=UPI0038BC188F
MIRKTVRKFVDENLRPLEREVDEADEVDPVVDKQLRKLSVELGLYGHNLPESVGGGGLNALAQVVIGEELGRTTVALAATLGYLPGSLKFVSPAQREWFLEPILRAEKLLAYAITEPDAGSDFSRVATRASKVGERWVLNGTKQFISGAKTADFVILLAVTDPQAPLRSRYTLFVVECAHPGFCYLRTLKKMGWHGSSLGVFALQDYEVPDTHVLGEVGGGFDGIMATINATRIQYSGRYIGMASELLELAVAYAKQRVTFGKPISEHQAIQFMLADSEVELQAARLLTYHAASLADAGDSRVRVAASRSKLYGSEMVGRVADRVLQIFGGAGYVSDLPIERMYRDARAFRIGEGTSEIHRIQIARDLLA